MLSIAASTVMALRRRPSRRIVQLMGRDIKTVRATIPMTVPSATSPRYTTASRREPTVVAASSAIPAEPASPRTRPSASGRVDALATKG